MPVSNYPTQNIHLPPHRTSLRISQIISLTGGGIISVVAIAVFLDWLFSLHIMTHFLGKSFINAPMVTAFTASCIVIFLYNRKGASIQGLNTIPILLGLLLLGIGWCTILDHFSKDFSMIGYFSAMDTKAGAIFILIGFSLVINFLKIPHRFHYAQLLTSIALFISLFGLLEGLYHFASVGKQNMYEQSSFFSSLLFFILCQSIIFAKPARGFIGLFTTASQSSYLARMSLMYFAILPPVLGFLVLLEERIALFDNNESIALLITSLMAVAVVITWINVRLLYPTEIKQFITQEALRVNNISLELTADDLSKKMNQLEQEKQKVADKLNYQQKITDLSDRLS